MGHGGAGAQHVFIAQLQRILADFFRQEVHEDFRCKFTLGRAIGPEGRAPGVIGAHRAADAPDVGDIVAGADELGPALGQQVAEF